MKTRNLIKLSAMLLAVVAITVAGCKKDDKDKTPDTASMDQLAVDQNNIETSIDEATRDIDGVFASHLKSSNFDHRMPCNVTIDSAAIANDTITLYLVYNGLNCNGKLNRTGKIEVKKRLSERWGEPNSSVAVKFIDYTVTRVSNSKSITLNGNKLFTNVSGGFIFLVGTLQDSAVYRTTASLQATFDDGSVRNWNVARLTTFTGEQDSLLMTIEGLGTSGSYNNIVMWGTNRESNEFFTCITTPVVHKQACGWDPCSGVKVHTIPATATIVTVTFGYNDNNEPITGNDCPTRYRIDWTKNGQSGTIYQPLP
jgi:hypothetical protein